MTTSEFEEKIKELKDEVAALPGDVAAAEIESTASRLEGFNFTPPIVIDITRFLRLTKTTLLQEIDTILAMPDAQACALAPDDPKKCQDLRIQFISVLIYYYKFLVQLREGNLEAWDEIDEVYVHD
ncbi:MAG: hypothetical protein D6B25_05375 [Desulfobulbaceae bacterium]|nr:MAG: hypothetical protein D6B25_05375 [Desulfobulbaceae bacterium]